MAVDARFPELTFLCRRGYFIFAIFVGTIIASFDVQFLPELVLRCYCELRGFPLALDGADRSFAHVKKDKPAVLAVRFCIILLMLSFQWEPAQAGTSLPAYPAGSSQFTSF